MKYSEVVILDNICSSCSGTNYIKESIVKIDENLIRIGVIKGKVYDKFSCTKCGKMFFEIKEVDYTRRPKY